MRKITTVLLAALSLAACGEDATSPQLEDTLLTEAAVLAYGALDMAQPGNHFLARLHSLPDHLRLTPEQITQINALVESFMSATAADRDALAAIHQAAREARQNGASWEEIRQILRPGHEIRARLHEAEQELRAAIIALLTPAQIGWLSRHHDRFCSPANVGLTEEQKTQITALVVAFELAHHADLEAIKAVFVQARAARLAGASREEVAAILAQAREPMQRVREAQAALEAAIRALLTPAQQACFGRWSGHH